MSYLERSLKHLVVILIILLLLFQGKFAIAGTVDCPEDCILIEVVIDIPQPYITYDDEYTEEYRNRVCCEENELPYLKNQFYSLSTSQMFSYGKPGFPELPYMLETVSSIPKGCRYISHEIIVLDQEELDIPDGGLIRPSQNPVSITYGGDSFEYPKSTLYSFDSEIAIPSEMNRQELVIVDYDQAKGTAHLLIHPAFVSQVDSNDSMQGHKIQYVTRIKIKITVCCEYFPPVDDTPNKYDMLIISNDFLIGEPGGSSDWTDYANLKNANGVKTRCISVSDIESLGYDGDLQQQIHKYIHLQAEQHGMRYVILGGETSIVPTRMVKPNDFPGTTIPCDTYYAVTDDQWDKDGSGSYEIENDVIDFTPEVFIGRIAVENHKEISNYISSSIKHYHYKDQQRDIVLRGDILWGDCHGGIHYDWIISRIPRLNSCFTIHKYYNSINNKVDVYDAVHAINEFNPIAISFKCHGSPTSMDGLELYHVLYDMVNCPPATLFYCGGCCTTTFCPSQTNFKPRYAEPCIAESINMKRDSGSLTYIGNTVYGWGKRNCDVKNDYSAQYEYHFWRSLLHYSDTGSIGEAFYISKDLINTLVHPNNRYYRYSFFSMTLLGDPSYTLKCTTWK
jgi:hypothetical protein